MAYKTLIFDADDVFEKFKPIYEREVQRGNLEIVAYAIFENEKLHLITDENKSTEEIIRDLDATFIFSPNNFYKRMKQFESFGIPRNKIFDGQILQVPNLDLSNLLKKGISYGILPTNPFRDISYVHHPRFYINKKNLLHLGVKSYIDSTYIDGKGIISVDNFSCISWNIIITMLVHTRLIILAGNFLQNFFRRKVTAK